MRGRARGPGRLWKRNGQWTLDWTTAEGLRERVSLSSNKREAEEIRGAMVRRRDLTVAGLVTEAGLRIVALERHLLWFPLLDPLLFQLGRRYPGLSARQSLLRVLRAPKVPIPGYYGLEMVIAS